MMFVYVCRFRRLSDNCMYDVCFFETNVSKRGLVLKNIVLSVCLLHDIVKQMTGYVLQGGNNSLST